VATSLELFRDRFPEFTAQSDALVTTKIAQAAARMDATAWGTLYTEAALFLAAHLLELTRRAQASGAVAAAGAITSMTTGRVSVSYGSTGGGSGSSGGTLDATPYGLEYQELLRISPNPGVMVVKGTE